MIWCIADLHSIYFIPDFSLSGFLELFSIILPLTTFWLKFNVHTYVMHCKRHYMNLKWCIENNNFVKLLLWMFENQSLLLRWKQWKIKNMKRTRIDWNRCAIKLNTCLKQVCCILRITSCGMAELVESIMRITIARKQQYLKIAFSEIYIYKSLLLLGQALH